MSDAMSRKVKPTKDRVLVKLRRDLQRIGSIWVPDGGQNLDIVCSEVIACGPDVRPWDIHAGDYVLHVRVVGVTLDGEMGSSDRKSASYKLLLQKECLAVVDPNAAGNVDGVANYDGGKLGMRDTSTL